MTSDIGRHHGRHPVLSIPGERVIPTTSYASLMFVVYPAHVQGFDLTDSRLHLGHLVPYTIILGYGQCHLLSLTTYFGSDV
jgi:hypothetical protein